MLESPGCDARVQKEGQNEPAMESDGASGPPHGPTPRGKRDDPNVCFIPRYMGLAGAIGPNAKQEYALRRLMMQLLLPFLRLCKRRSGVSSRQDAFVDPAATNISARGMTSHA